MFKVQFEAATRQEFYQYLHEAANFMFCYEADWLADLANAAALLYINMQQINWSGFYLYRGGELVLGPFQGKPACVRIELGKGVCGTAAATGETQLVPDVHQFPGHIACDEASQSEIVIPMIKDGRLLGVLDIDSPIKNRFNEEDQAGLEELVAILIKYIDWSKLAE